MVDQQLAEFVSQQLAQNKSRDDIIKALLAQGYAIQDVITVLNEAQLAGDAVSLSPSSPVPVSTSTALAQPATPLVVHNDSPETSVPLAQTIQNPSPSIPNTKFPGVFALLGTGISIYRQRFGVLCGIGFIQVLVLLILELFGIGFVGEGLLVGKDISFGLLLVLTLLLAILFICIILPLFSVWTALAMMFATHARAENISLGESFKQGWKKVGSLIWICILQFLIGSGMIFIYVVVPGVILGIILLLFRTVIGSGFLLIGAVLLGIILLALLIGISITVSTWFMFSFWELIDNDKRGLNAILTSKERVKPHFNDLLWRMVGVSFILIVAGLILEAVVGLPLTLLLKPVTILGSINIGTELNEIVVGLVNSLLIAPLSIAAFCALYECAKLLDPVVGDFPKGAKKSFILYSIVGIFGFLVLCIAPAFILAWLDTAKASSNDAIQESDLNTLQTELVLYYVANNNEYPNTLSDLATTTLNGWSPLPIEETEDPITKLPYDYSVLENHQNYSLCVVLTTGKKDCLNGDDFSTASSTASAVVTETPSSVTPTPSYTSGAQQTPVALLNAQPYINTTYGYSIKMPSGWIPNGSGDPGITYATSDGIASLRVWMTSASSNSTPTEQLNTYVQEKIASLEQSLPGFQITVNSSSSLGGSPEQILDGVWTDASNDNQDVTLIYMIAHDNYIYEITATTLNTDLPQYRLLFNASIATFSFQN